MVDKYLKNNGVNMFYTYFVNKSTQKALQSNQDFVKAELGTSFRKSDGTEYIKTDTIVFDKANRTVRSDEENDRVYGRLNNVNVWSQGNTFNNITKILQATFNNKTCTVDGAPIQHTSLIIPDISCTHDFTGNDVEFHNGKVTGSLVATCRPVFDNLTVIGETKSGTLVVSSDSTLNRVSLSSLTSASINNSGHCNTQSLTVANTGTIKALTTTSLNVNDKIITKDLTASGATSLNNVTATKITSSNIIPDNASANIGTASNVYANMYATNFNGTALRAKYADLAEKYTTDIEYQPGTVLQVNTIGDSELSIFNGGTYAGVVSTHPAVKMNSTLNGQYIALKGRVPVRCKGVVQKGMYCVAQNGGVVRGFSKSDITPELMLNIVGVALSDSKPDETVEVML